MEGSGAEKAPVRSWWLAQALAADPGEPCPPLAGSTQVDVCIVGGGYTGLWTAIELAERDPALKVVLLERDICGTGASGRNGGFVTAWWDQLRELQQAFGREHALFLADASEAAVVDIGSFCETEGIDAHYRSGGYLWAAAGPAQLGVYDRAVAACAAIGRADALRLVDGTECRRRIGSPVLLGGALMATSASVQPALLARGLRKAALARGVRIYEGSPMRRLDSGPSPSIVTPSGRVQAAAVVLATGAWTARQRHLRRAIVPVASQIVVTEPIPGRVGGMGWTGGELFCDGRVLLHYAHVTRDGRIAFGGPARTIGSAGRISARMHGDERVVPELISAFRTLFPDLADCCFTHSWAGPVDWTAGRLHLPFFDRLGGDGRVVYGAGFAGNGVGPSRVAGRILASLALDHDDEWSRCGLVGGPRALFPPEPFRTLGGHAVRAALRRKEERQQLGRRVDPLTRGLAALVRAGLPPSSKGREKPPRA